MRKLFLIMMTLIACSLSLAAQTRTYHGTVVDAANNEPLIGATVMPVGGGQGAAADLDGNFTVTVPANVKKATFSYVGYNSQTVDLHEGMTVRLSAGDTNLDDVVVVAYGTATKESLTGSVAVVGNQEIEDRPITSVTTALEGNAPGVQVNSSTGAPGAAPAIAIRGFNSITGSSSPLYVVDGVPYEGSIADLNPADIESMSVLKDAASCALYGNRGANGVILITTKAAKKVGKVDVTLQIRQGMYNRGLPFYDRLSPAQWMQTAFDGQVNSLVNSGAYASRQEAVAVQRESFVSSFAKLNIFGSVDAEGNPVPAADNALFDESGKFLFTDNDILPGYRGDLDWWTPVSRTGHRQEYTVNAAAAGEKYNVFASAGYLKENGYMLQTDFERFNGRINANFNPVSYLKFGINLAATAQESMATASMASGNYVGNPFLVMFTAPIYPYYAHNADGSVIMNEDGTPQWNVTGYLGNSNIGYAMRLDQLNNSATVVDGTVYGTAVIPYGFELTFRGNMHRDKTHTERYMNNEVGSAMGMGRLAKSFGSYKNHTFQQMLNWSHDYGLHHVDVLLDHENYEYWSDAVSLQKIDQVFPGMIAFDNFREYENSGESAGKLRTESYLARARYNYDNRYFGEFSIRRDGSSRFAKDTRWGNFWSLGGSWIISSEHFMQNATWVDYLKLRAAYGSVGNDAGAGMIAYRSMYSILPYNGAIGIIPAQIAASGLKWESTDTFDIGIEGNLFRKLNFNIGYFYKINEDLLYNVSYPPSIGMLGNSGYIPSITSNVGSMQNTGWEIALGYTIFDRPDFFWDVRVDATFYKNKILKLPSGRNIPGQGLFMGQSIGCLYNYVWAGIDELTGQSLYEMHPESPDYVAFDEQGNYSEKDTKDAYEAAVRTAKENGEYLEIDGKPYTTNASNAGRMICGTSLPTVYGSVSTNVGWKGIQLSLLFTYSLGGKLYDSNYSQLMQVGTTAAAIHKDLLNAWTAAPEGLTEHRIDPNGIPQIDPSREMENNAESSRWYITKNNLVLKNINLSYDLPRKWVSAMMLQKLNLGVSIDNLFIVSARKGMNPNYNFGSSQGASYVPARVFSFQLTANF